MNARIQLLCFCALALCVGFDWPGQASRLAADLATAGPRERREIVRLLAASGSAEARAAILRACSDADVAVRREALRAAGRTGALEAAPALLKALSDPDAAIRAAAAEALGSLAVKDAAQPLARALTDSEASVRRAAVTALSRLPQGPQSIVLFTALDDSDPEVRIEAVRQLASSNSERARDAVLGKTRDAAPEVRVAALNAVAGSADPRAALALTQALDDSSDPVVLAAIRGLRSLPSSNSSAIIAALTRSSRARVAVAAQLSVEQAQRSKQEAIGSAAPAGWIVWLERTVESSAAAEPLIDGLERTLPVGEELALDPLLLFLPRVPTALRARMVRLIGRTHAKAGGPVLVKLIDDKNPQVRAATATALAELAYAPASPRLLPLLGDDAAVVRTSAAHALGVLSNQATFSELVRLAESTPVDRGQLAAVLTAIADGTRRLRKQLSADDKARLLSVLREHLKIPDGACSVEAARALGELGDAAAVAALSAIPQRESPGLRVAATRALLRADAASAVRALRGLVRDPHVTVRATAIAALGITGDARDVPVVDRARREGPWPMGPVATFALASLVMRGHGSSDRLCGLLDEQEPLTRANARAGLRKRPSKRCAAPVPLAGLDVSGAHERSFATWRALWLTDGRVLVSHPDSLGKVEFPQMQTVRSESPWRYPYGVSSGLPYGVP